MKHVAIIYFSGYGHTEKQAQAVLAGVQEAKAPVQLIKIDAEGNLSDESWAILDQADAIIFGTPTYMAMAAWQFKKFADASSRRWSTLAWKDKIAAAFTNSASINGDKAVTMQWLYNFAMQHGMVWVGLGLLPSSTLAAQRNDINWLGTSAGAFAQSPSDSSPEQGPLPGDLATAKILGQRVADWLAKIKD